MKFFDNFSFDFDLIINKVNENINWFYDYISIPYKHSEVIKVFQDVDIENKYEKLAIAGLVFTSNLYVKSGLILINVTKIILEEVYTLFIIYEKEFVINLNTCQYYIDGRKMILEQDDEEEEEEEEKEDDEEEEEKEDTKESKWDQPLDGEILIVETEELTEEKKREEKQEVNSSTSWFGFGSKDKLKDE